VNFHPLRPQLLPDQGALIGVQKQPAPVVPAVQRDAFSATSASCTGAARVPCHRRIASSTTRREPSYASSLCATVRTVRIADHSDVQGEQVLVSRGDLPQLGPVVRLAFPGRDQDPGDLGRTEHRRFRAPSRRQKRVGKAHRCDAETAGHPIFPTQGVGNNLRSCAPRTRYIQRSARHSRLARERLHRHDRPIRPTPVRSTRLFLFVSRPVS
jgi:hypothetical protein